MEQGICNSGIDDLTTKDTLWSLRRYYQMIIESFVML